MTVWIPASAFGQPVSNKPYWITQPDGQRVQLQASGDEFYSYIHDALGSIVVQNSAGCYVYALVDADGGLVPSQTLVGAIAQFSDKYARIEDINVKDIVAANPNYQDRVNNTEPAFSLDGEPAIGRQAGSTSSAIRGIDPVYLYESTDLHNLVVFIRFSGDPEWVDASVVDTYKGRLNNDDYSLKNSIEMQSEGECSVESVFPVVGGTDVLTYVDQYPRGYYLPYNSSTNPAGYPNEDAREAREHALVSNATMSIASAANLPSGSELDQDGDGYLDSVTFIVGGQAVVDSVLWGHTWGVPSSTASVQGKQLYGYTFQMQDDSSANVFIHEFLHILGFPDLYRYVVDGDPVGAWDIMGATSRTQPQMANAVMRYLYAGWGPDIPDGTLDEPISVVATSRYEESSLLPRAVVWHLSGSQYLACEFRSKGGSGFDSGVPVSGLIMYRVDLNVGHGNMFGPPDGYYVYREGISSGWSAEGVPLNSPTSNKAALSSELGRTTFGSPTNLSRSIFIYDGDYSTELDAYLRTGAIVYDVGSSSGPTMTFKVGTYQSNTSQVTYTTSSPMTFQYSGAKYIKGYLSDSSGRIANVGNLFLEHSADGLSWSRVATSYAVDSAGQFAIRVRPSANKYYRVAWTGDITHKGSTGSTIIARVRAYLTAPRTSTLTPRVGSRVTVSGTLKPQHKSAIVQLVFEQKVGTSWVKRLVKKVSTVKYSTYSRYSTSHYFPSKGAWRIRAYHSDSGHIGGYSSYGKTITVR